MATSVEETDIFDALSLPAFEADAAPDAAAATTAAALADDFDEDIFVVSFFELPLADADVEAFAADADDETDFERRLDGTDAVLVDATFVGEALLEAALPDEAFPDAALPDADFVAAEDDEPAADDFEFLLPVLGLAAFAVADFTVADFEVGLAVEPVALDFDDFWDVEGEAVPPFLAAASALSCSRINCFACLIHWSRSIRPEKFK